MKLHAFVIDLDGPITWDQFKQLPKDLQRDYLIRLKTEFHASNHMIGEKMGAHENTVAFRYRNLGVDVIHGHCKPEQLAAWESFWTRPRWHRDLSNCVQGALMHHPFLNRQHPEVRVL